MGDNSNRFVAFLRGVNVGGHNQIRMTDLVRRFTSLGLEDVSSFKQSGNVVFTTDIQEEVTIVRMIEEDLSSVSKDVVVFLRTMSHVGAMVRSEPFKDRAIAETMRYVTFLPYEAKALRAPIWTTSKDVEVFLVQGREAFSMAYKRGERFGQPNGFIEHMLKVDTTTRNWNSIEGIVESYPS
jgi:uncharacterized protein (DUF1697 family)